MANLVLPNPEIPIGTMKCPHCGKDHEVKLNPVWFRLIKAFIDYVNANL